MWEKKGGNILVKFISLCIVKSAVYLKRRLKFWTIKKAPVFEYSKYLGIFWVLKLNSRFFIFKLVWKELLLKLKFYLLITHTSLEFAHVPDTFLLLLWNWYIFFFSLHLFIFIPLSILTVCFLILTSLWGILFHFMRNVLHVLLNKLASVNKLLNLFLALNIL